MYSFRWFDCFVLAVLGSIVSVSGCGEGAPAGPPRATISGKIKLDGKPVEGGEIRFRPTTGSETVSRISADGGYKIDNVVDGPVVGQNKVFIEWYRDSGKKDAEDHMIPEAAIPAKYNSETTLSVEIKAGANEHNFDLQSK